jgi:hypothetical protein
MDRPRIPPIAWRPTPRTVSDLNLAGICAAWSYLGTLVEPTLGTAGLVGTAAWTGRRFWRSHQLTQASRRGWRIQAYGVLTRQAQLRPPDGWGDPVDSYVLVFPEDWTPSGPAQPPNPQHGWRPIYREWRGYRRRQRLEGMRVIPQRVYLLVPPRSIIHWRHFRRHWNEVQGYPGSVERPVDPWRWTADRRNTRIIGDPFSLPLFIPLPDAWPSWDQLRLGVLEDGSELVWSLLDIPHGLVGGSTRFGKTNLLRTIAFQLILAALWNNQQPGVVILDPKGDEYVAFEGLPWNGRTCEGVCVAVDDLDADGELTNLDNMEQAARDVRMELGRRRRTSRVAERQGITSLWRPIMLLVDEAAELLEREPVSKSDPEAVQQAARRRNAQRSSIERSIRTIARLGAKFRIHVLAAAQSPRAEFLPSDAKVNLAFLLFVGPGSPVELGIIFGKDLPDSPPARRGMGVWKDSREGMDPADPYLYLKLYWTAPDMIRDRLAPLRAPDPDTVAA